MIRVRVTEEEERIIQDKASSCSMSGASFLRKLASGLTPKSTLDQQGIALMARTSGEQGKLGGLLKIAILELQGRKGSEALVSEIRDLALEIQKNQAGLKDLISGLKD